MQQPNLLELAKHGEPTAIAALMNAVLSPKGITAQASMDEDCLCVLLESQKPLNQETLVTFIEKGLLELGNDSIHSVRAQAKKIGEERFAWTREFPLRSSEPSTPVETLTAPVTLSISSDTQREAAVATLDAPPESQALREEAIPEVEYPVTDALEELHSPSAELIEEVYSPAAEAAEEAHFPIAEVEAPNAIADIHSSIAEVEAPNAIADIHFPIAEVEAPTADATPEAHLPIAETIEEEEELEESFSLRGWLRTRWRVYAIPVALVVIGGFVAGGTTAFWSTAKSQSQGSGETVSKSHNDAALERQKEAEGYLKAMMTAQEKFYQHNKRFARSLEELERSANVISQSYSYAYRLRVGTDSVITAAPREADLHSYIGVVTATSSGTESLICQSLKPSVQAPEKPSTPKGKPPTCSARSKKL